MSRRDSEIVPTVVPIVFDRLDRLQLSGRDIGNAGEPVLDIVLPTVIRGKAALINRSTPANLGVLRLLANDSNGLYAASRREAASVKAQAERPCLSFAQRQAHRECKKALFDGKAVENS